MSIFNKKNSIAFGTSGARGLVDDFTQEVCAAFTRAFLAVMCQQYVVAKLAIAIDRRPSSPQMAAACSAAAQNLGINVEYYGILPTPALALKAIQEGIPAIMITGSHIPFDRNGIKFYRPDGEISKADEQEIIDKLTISEVFHSLKYDEHSNDASDLYKKRYLDIFPEKPLQGWRVGLYEHSSAGRDINREILIALGAEVISLARSENFIPIDTEAVTAEDFEKGINWAKEHHLDALFSTDGDGDRPLIADEKGHWLRGDIVGLLCARELKIDALSIPVSCNTAIEKCAIFSEVVRTRIGSPYVIEGMEKLLAAGYKRVAGFEANGGFLLASTVNYGNAYLEKLPTRDALLPALTVMVAAARQRLAISALLESLPARYTASDRLQNFSIEYSRCLLAKWRDQLETLADTLRLPEKVIAIDETDGLRFTLANQDIVHLRPSGNAPELRCYAESSSEKAATTLVASTLQYLSSLN